jgi:hypothetical protein
VIFCVQDSHELDTESSNGNVQAVNNILPSECGKRSLDIADALDDQQARVVGGYEVVRGSYPWQVIKQKNTLCRELLI